MFPAREEAVQTLAEESSRKGLETFCSLTSRWVRREASHSTPVKPSAPQNAEGLVQGVHLLGGGDTGLLRLQGGSGRC